jgi:hypothetical protein
MMCDTTGRHLVMMPHIERSTFPWNWAYYPTDYPWIEAFDARLWIEKHSFYKKMKVSPVMVNVCLLEAFVQNA